MLLTSKAPKIPAQSRSDLSVLRASFWSEIEHLLCVREDAVLWQRELPKTVQDWLNRIPETHLPSARIRLVPAEIGACVAKVFRDAGHTENPALSWFCRDAERLAIQFAELNGVSIVRLRIEAVFDDACRKFHVDHVTTRLICTYRGPGTQLCMCPHGRDRIETISTGAPILLKGKLWSQPDDIALHHRSPPIEGTGLSRSVLVLDPVHEDDEIGTSYDRRFKPN